MNCNTTHYRANSSSVPGDPTGVDAIIHFAASIVVPDSIRDPLGYYRNNTMNSRALIECAVNAGVRHFIFSSTAAVYGNPTEIPVQEDSATLPISPYGWSKLMTEIMLRDAGNAYGLQYVMWDPLESTCRHASLSIL